MRKLSVLTTMLGVLATATLASAAEVSVFVQAGPQLVQVKAGQIIGEPLEAQPAFVPAPAPAADLQAPQPGAPPLPGAPPEPAGGNNPTPPAATSVKLYHCVKYEDLHHIAPCAVPKIVAIVDPCYKPCRVKRCGCCRPCAPPPPPCVYVKICVPKCGCPRVKVSRDGKRVKYDYGKYEVELASRNGKVYVDYDD